MPLWKNGAFVDNDWVIVEDDSPIPDDAPAFVGIERWRAEREALAGRNAPIGLILSPGDEWSDVVGDLSRFPAIALRMPKFADGRAFSIARLLRDRDGYAGEIRAVGENAAAARYAGIPVTHRDTNHNVTFLTGHDATGVMPDAIDWTGVARSSPVIVMYMAMKHIGTISARLIAEGRSPDEPVAFVCNATTAQQQVLETTLARAETDVAGAGLSPPAIVVVGEVVRMRAALDWLGAATEGRKLVTDPLGSRSKDRSA